MYGVLIIFYIDPVFEAAPLALKLIASNKQNLCWKHGGLF